MLDSKEATTLFEKSSESHGEKKINLRFYIEDGEIRFPELKNFGVKTHIKALEIKGSDHLSSKSPVSIKENIKINHFTLKVEKVNAKGMIEGFRKNDGHHYVTIFTASKNSWSLKNNFRQKPKIITTMRGKPKSIYPLSGIGKELNAEKYVHNTRYLAILDRIFHIRNDFRVWNALCNNGTFDIWEPKALFNSLEGKQDPMILLLRLFEIDHDFSDEIQARAQFDIVEEEVVKISKLLIPNEDFIDITFKIKSAVENFLIREEPVFDTSKMQ